MSDELPENPPPATTPPAATAQQPAANPLELPEVKAAIAEAAERARNATWKQARETLSTKKPNGAPSTSEQQPPPAAATPQAAGMGPQDILRISAFTAAAAEHGIPARGVELLLTDLMTAKPADVRAWVGEQAASFGWTKPTPNTNPATQPVNTPAASPTAANANPVTGSAAPSNPTTVVITEDTPLINLSEQQRQDWINRNGWLKYTDRMRDEALRNGTKVRLPR